MGGAFTALADDFTAVYYNPAGLMYPKTLDRYYEVRGWSKEGVVGEEREKELEAMA